MDKWADYSISEVRYNTEHTHIEKAKVHEDKGDKMGGAVEWTRSQIVVAIENGKSFVTILRNASNNWGKGEDLRIITINSTKYIRTDANSTAADNLGELPEF